MRPATGGYGDLNLPLRPPLAMNAGLAAHRRAAALGQAPATVDRPDTAPRGRHGYGRTFLPPRLGAPLTLPGGAVAPGTAPAWRVACSHTGPRLAPYARRATARARSSGAETPPPLASALVGTACPAR